MTRTAKPEDHVLTLSQEAEGWGFVLQHDRVIEKITRKFAQFLPFDDLVQSVRVRLVEVHHRYDPARSGPTTWIGWWVRSVVHREAKRVKRVPDLVDPLPPEARNANHRRGCVDVIGNLPARGYGTARDIENRAEIRKLMQCASDPQYEAIRTHLNGMDRDEAVRAYGISLNARNSRIRNLARATGARASE